MTATDEEVSRYLRRMNEYLECLQNESSDASSEAKRLINEWNSEVDTFNSTR